MSKVKTYKGNDRFQELNTIIIDKKSGLMINGDIKYNDKGEMEKILVYKNDKELEKGKGTEIKYNPDSISVINIKGDIFDTKENEFEIKKGNLGKLYDKILGEMYGFELKEAYNYFKNNDSIPEKEKQALMKNAHKFEASLARVEQSLNDSIKKYKLDLIDGKEIKVINNKFIKAINENFSEQYKDIRVYNEIKNTKCDYDTAKERVTENDKIRDIAELKARIDFKDESLSRGLDTIWVQKQNPDASFWAIAKDVVFGKKDFGFNLLLPILSRVFMSALKGIFEAFSSDKFDFYDEKYAKLRFGIWQRPDIAAKNKELAKEYKAYFEKMKKDKTEFNKLNNLYETTKNEIKKIDDKIDKLKGNDKNDKIGALEKERNKILKNFSKEFEKLDKTNFSKELEKNIKDKLNNLENTKKPIEKETENKSDKKETENVTEENEIETKENESENENKNEKPTDENEDTTKEKPEDETEDTSEDNDDEKENENEDDIFNEEDRKGSDLVDTSDIEDEKIPVSEDEKPENEPDNENEKPNDEVENNKEKPEVPDKKYDDLLKEIDALKKENGDYKTENENLKKENDTLKVEKNDLNTSLETKNNEISKLTNKNDDLMTKNEKLLNEKNDIENKNNDLKNDLSKANEKINDLSLENKKLENEKTDLETENNDLKKENAEINEAKNGLELENKRMKGENDNLKIEVSKLNENKASLENKIGNIENQKKDLQAELKEIKDINKALEGKIKNFENEKNKSVELKSKFEFIAEKNVGVVNFEGCSTKKDYDNLIRNCRFASNLDKGTPSNNYEISKDTININIVGKIEAQSGMSETFAKEFTIDRNENGKMGKITEANSPLEINFTEGFVDSRKFKLDEIDGNTKFESYLINRIDRDKNKGDEVILTLKPGVEKVDVPAELEKLLGVENGKELLEKFDNYEDFIDKPDGPNPPNGFDGVEITDNSNENNYDYDRDNDDFVD